MIKRYSRKQLTDIWSEENKYKIWLDVEIAAAEAMEKLGQIPRGVASIVRKKAKINVSRIHKIESEVKHDVIAFLSSVTEKAGIKARYLHQGMTSSDVTPDRTCARALSAPSRASWRDTSGYRPRPMRCCLRFRVNR